MDVARGRAISSCNLFFNSTGGRVVIYLPTTVHFNNVHPKKSTHKAWKMLIFLICIWFNSPLFLPMLNLSCVYNLRVFSSTWSDLVMPVAAFNVLCAVCTMLRLFSIHFHTKHSMLFMQDWYMAEMYAVYPPHPTPPRSSTHWFCHDVSISWVWVWEWSDSSSRIFLFVLFF